MSSSRVFSRRRFATSSAGALALAATGSFAVTSLATATSTDRMQVNASGLRLRSGPGTGYAILASLAKGAIVRVLEQAGNANGYAWVKVQVEATGKTGFVAASFLSPLSGGGQLPAGSMVHVFTGGGRANLRSAPGTSARIVTTVGDGTTGTVMEGPVPANGYSWYKINFGDVRGWMAHILLAPGGGSDRARVKVASGPLNVRREPAGTIITTVPTGTTGFVTTDMPQDANGYTWVNVQFDSGIRGWVAKNFLTWL